MSGDGPAPPPRPWWVPLLGVGSLGLGGLQAAGGLALLGVASRFRGETASALLLAGLAWVVPGAILAASGIAVVAGWRSARLLCLLAAAAWGAAAGGVALHRAAIPPAVADLVEMAAKEGGARKGLADLLADLRRDPAGDPVKALRDPAQADLQGAVFAGYCSCPALPWMVLLVLFAVLRGRRGASAAS